MRTVLITGATSGIGYELAKIFAQNKYNLVLTGRNEEKLNEIKNEFLTHNISINTFSCNLSKPNSASQLFEFLNKNNLEIDILINNAGFGLLGPFNELDLQSQLEMIQVNITSLVELTHLIIPSMIKRKSGKIMNVASTAAFQPGPYMAIYYATKSFVLSFSEALHYELKEYGINVSALCPGPTKTDFQRRARMENINLERSKLFPYMSAEKVAKIGFEKLMKGKRVIIPGAMNKIGVVLVKFVPKKIVLNLIKIFNSKR